MDEEQDMNSKESNEHDFSIELKSNKNLTSLSTSNEQDHGVVIEGTLGKHVKATFVDATVLEVQGESGVLRLSISKDEITIPKTPEQAAKEA